MTDSTLKKCFVICPIGEPNSDARIWSDDIFFHLIDPVAQSFGYHARRAIDESRPGEITTNIIEDIIDADLVIADLTFHNANVFYELALRHAQGTPFFHVAASGTKVPFDISTINTVFIDQRSFGSIEATRKDLQRHFQAVSDGIASFDNPVKRHQQKLKADQSGDPLEKRVVAIEEQVGQIARQQREQIGEPNPFKRALADSRFAATNQRLLRAQDREIDKILTRNQFKLIFNPETGASKFITFLEDGVIGEGRNRNEARWRVVDGQLEILDSNNEVHSRFIFVNSNNSFHHTNDPDTRSIRGQSIVVENV